MAGLVRDAPVAAVRGVIRARPAGGVTGAGGVRGVVGVSHLRELFFSIASAVVIKLNTRVAIFKA